ncbi:MAG: hypothetical protein FJ316_05905 [SAR202 cluster bacterium]|nr:hypothetical protein [SAR202 cluster bacterium]
MAQEFSGLEHWSHDAGPPRCEPASLPLCAWCFPHWPVGVLASHGVCPRHFRELMAQLEQLERS